MKISASIFLALLLLFCFCKKKVTTVHPADSKSEAPAPASQPDREEIRRKVAELESRKTRHSVQRSLEKASSEEFEDHLHDSRVMEHSESDSPEKVRQLSEPKKSVRPTSRKISRASEVKAAAHNDNEEFHSYQQYCNNIRLPFVPKNWKINERYIIRIIDSDGEPVHNAGVSLKKGEYIWEAITPASGEIVLFPGMDLDKDYEGIQDYTITSGNVSRQIEQKTEPIITVQHDTQRAQPQQVPLQICFLVDATGSMGDEIRQLKDVIFSIHSRIVNHPSNPAASFSLVAFRDIHDEFLVRGHPFTSSIDTFQMILEPLRAGGGGDRPEDICAGLQYTVDSLQWNPEAIKFVFLIGDAPTHVGRHPVRDYLWASREARSEGIKIVSIGASGLCVAGEFMFRQMALLTGGEFVFLHYGEKGESKGAGTAKDPGKVSHHTGSNYNVRRLDDIVVDMVTRELEYIMPPVDIVRQEVDVHTNTELYDLRLSNLLMQVFRSDLPLENTTVALSPFAFEDSTLSSFSEYLWERALEKTVSLLPVNVIEREKLEEILRENSIELSGLAGEIANPKIGKLLSADYLAFGRIHYVGSVRMCHMRLVDAASGKIVSASRIRF